MTALAVQHSATWVSLAGCLARNRKPFTPGSSGMAGLAGLSGLAGLLAAGERTKTLVRATATREKPGVMGGSVRVCVCVCVCWSCRSRGSLSLLSKACKATLGRQRGNWQPLVAQPRCARHAVSLHPHCCIPLLHPTTTRSIEPLAPQPLAPRRDQLGRSVGRHHLAAVHLAVHHAPGRVPCLGPLGCD
ncbi:hypothetical protein BC831DRAFT_141604 [Entophlyctis helioformis]|nr:hypothetical protein BC831DRAFT_141604 [Entophlyctis helioformis]